MKKLSEKPISWMVICTCIGILTFSYLSVVKADYTPTWDCEVWCSGCFLIQHHRTVTGIPASTRAEAEEKAKEWYKYKVLSQRLRERAIEAECHISD